MLRSVSNDAMVSAQKNSRLNTPARRECSNGYSYLIYIAKHVRFVCLDFFEKPSAA